VPEFTPIGIIHSPFQAPEETPVQPAGGAEVAGTVEVFEPYRAGLKDLEGFSHLVLLFHFDRSRGYDLHVVPYLDTELRGVFATRAPRRPNPIGLSVVRLERIEDGLLHIRGIDMLDGTPLLDIKPYVPAFEAEGKIRSGWLETAAARARDCRADGRFK
jgi:tRNA-Thr(GGU) m(6)t(6)A37 methyltransferase TsaA